MNLFRFATYSVKLHVSTHIWGFWAKCNEIKYNALKFKSYRTNNVQILRNYYFIVGFTDR